MSITDLNCFLSFYTALSLKQFRHALNILSQIHLFPMRPVTRYAELSMRIKILSTEVKEEIPRIIFNCLVVHQILCQKASQIEANELVGDIRNLIEYFGELQHNLKGIESIEEKFKMYSGNVREILSSILIN